MCNSVELTSLCVESVSIGLCCSGLLIDIKVVDVKLACIVIGFYSFSLNVCLKVLSHEWELKKKKSKMDHRLGFLNQCGQIWLWYCKADWILEEMQFFVCLVVHFLCLIFIYYMNSLKMSVVAVCSEKVSGLLPGGSWFRPLMWFWSISS